MSEKRCRRIGVYRRPSAVASAVPKDGGGKLSVRKSDVVWGRVTMTRRAGERIANHLEDAFARFCTPQNQKKVLRIRLDSSQWPRLSAGWLHAAQAPALCGGKPSLDPEALDGGIAQNPRPLPRLQAPGRPNARHGRRGLHRLGPRGDLAWSRSGRNEVAPGECRASTGIPASGRRTSVADPPAGRRARTALTPRLSPDGPQIACARNTAGWGSTPRGPSYRGSTATVARRRPNIWWKNGQIWA